MAKHNKHRPITISLPRSAAVESLMDDIRRQALICDDAIGRHCVKLLRLGYKAIQHDMQENIEHGKTNEEDPFQP